MSRGCNCGSTSRMKRAVRMPRNGGDQERRRSRHSSMAEAFLDNRRQAILRSILTAASVECVIADMDVVATSRTSLVQNDRTETSWTWIWLLFFAVAGHWCGSRYPSLEIRISSRQRARCASRQAGREADSGKFHHTICSRLKGALVCKRQAVRSMSGVTTPASHDLSSRSKITRPGRKSHSSQQHAPSKTSPC